MKLYPVAPLSNWIREVVLQRTRIPRQGLLAALSEELPKRPTIYVWSHFSELMSMFLREPVIGIIQ